MLIIELFKPKHVWVYLLGEPLLVPERVRSLFPFRLGDFFEEALVAKFSFLVIESGVIFAISCSVVGLVILKLGLSRTLLSGLSL